MSFYCKSAAGESPRKLQTYSWGEEKALSKHDYIEVFDSQLTRGFNQTQGEGFLAPQIPKISLSFLSCWIPWLEL